MPTYALENADSELIKLVEQAAESGGVKLTRAGQPVAEIRASREKRGDGTISPFILEQIRLQRARLPKSTAMAADIVRAMRDEE